MLAMGGLALGEAVTSSGLLQAVATAVSELVDGLGVWVVLAIFCVLVLVATTFISHTVGAMIILPVVQTVGAQLPVRQLPQGPLFSEICWAAWPGASQHARGAVCGCRYSL